MSVEKKMYNPKSVAPAVYIPCWLIQVPHSQLSFGAKLLYGRLSQWANETGDVYRSTPALAKELGMATRTVEKFIKELKSVELIETFQIEKGGINHFKFYQHEWMFLQIAKELTYTNIEQHPPHNHAVPPAQPCGTPPHNHADININKIKTNNNLSLIDENKSVKTLKPVVYADTIYDQKEPHDEEQSNATFDHFWELYPVKKGEKRARCAWYSQKCYLIYNEIIEKLKQQITSDAQFIDGYAVNPDKYIHEERWKDEILVRKPKKFEAVNHFSDWDLNLDKDIL